MFLNLRKDCEANPRSLGLSFFKKSTIFLSVIVDVSILGTLFIIGLSVTAWTTAGGGYFFP